MASTGKRRAFGGTLGIWSHFRALLVCDHMSPSETSSGSSSPRDRGTFPAAPSAVRATAAAEPRARVALAPGLVPRSGVAVKEDGMTIRSAPLESKRELYVSTYSASRRRSGEAQTNRRGSIVTHGLADKRPKPVPKLRLVLLGPQHGAWVVAIACTTAPVWKHSRACKVVCERPCSPARPASSETSLTETLASR